jgi:chromosome segregation ATPase
MKHDANTQAIVRLKKECDDLSFLMNEKGRVVADVQQDLGATRDQIARKETDISGLQRDVAQKSDNGYQLRKDIDTLLFEVSKLKEEKGKDLDEIQRLRELNAYRERENDGQGQRIRATDYELAKTHDRANELSKIAEGREFDLRRTTEVLEAAQSELANLKDQSARQQQDNAAAQRNLERGNDDRLVLLRQKDAEAMRSKDLQAVIFDLEAKIRARDDQIAITRKEGDDVKFSNAGITDRNSVLRAEIAALTQHIAILEQQNRELNKELEVFVQTDEQIRQNLNRRDRVETLKRYGEYELQKSYAELERQSPVRRGTGTSFR